MTTPAAPAAHKRSGSGDDVDGAAFTSKRSKGTGHTDVVLISSDGIRFEVNQLNLKASSPVFADMFEIGSASADRTTPEITLVEDSKVLKELLPFIYPRPVDSEQSLFERLGRPLSSQSIGFSAGVCNFLRACDKYEIWRAIEAFERELHAAVQRPVLLVPAFAFAAHFKFRRLAEEAANRMADTMNFQEVIDGVNLVAKEWISIQPEKLALLVRGPPTFHNRKVTIFCLIS